MKYMSKAAIFLMIFKNACPYYFRNNFSLCILCGTALMIFFSPSSAVGWKGYPRTGYILVGKQKIPLLEMSELTLLNEMLLIIR